MKYISFKICSWPYHYSIFKINQVKNLTNFTKATSKKFEIQNEDGTYGWLFFILLCGKVEVDKDPFKQPCTQNLLNSSSCTLCFITHWAIVYLFPLQASHTIFLASNHFMIYRRMVDNLIVQCILERGCVVTLYDSVMLVVRQLPKLF